jgi:ketosteroid isomerase-like protein
MSASPLDVATRIYAGFNARDFEACRACLAPSIEFVTLDLRLRPRRLVGRDEAIGFLEELLAPLAEMRLELLAATEVGDHVLTSVDHLGRATRDAPQTSQILHHLWRVEDGLAAAFRLYLDEARALRSARAREAVARRSVEASR